VAFVGTLVFLYLKSRGEAPVYKTEQPKVTDIVKKAVATGSIVPRREVSIKPRVSGIVKELRVEPGDLVEQGTLIAEVKIVPNMAALTQAEAAVHKARIAVKHAEAEMHRAERLSGGGLLSQRALSERQLDFNLRRAELSAAISQLQVVKEGASQARGDTANTKIRSTVAGMVLEVPVEEGGSVIESNNFNEGTTIATVADMGDMIFLGHIDEADVDKVRVGMAVKIRIGAIDERQFDGKLEYIAPKGKEIEGAIQFEIKAALKTAKGVTIRAGYSANAEIVLEERSQVLAVSESLLQFDGDQPYVEVETAPGVYERRDLTVGISDGINIEVTDGVTADSKIRQPQPKPEG
jgi:HlyD family secretion protein